MRVASWYFVHIYGRWNEEAGTKITPFKITTEGLEVSQCKGKLNLK